MVIGKTTTFRGNLGSIYTQDINIQVARYKWTHTEQTGKSQFTISAPTETSDTK